MTEVQEAQGFRGQICVRTSHSQRARLQLPPAKKAIWKRHCKDKVNGILLKATPKGFSVKRTTFHFGSWFISVISLTN